jgi:hypothetical protein
VHAAGKLLDVDAGVNRHLAVRRAMSAGADRGNLSS